MVRPVKAMRVPDPLWIRSRPFPGVIRAEDRVNLSFRVDGPLIEFPVDVGDLVKEQEVLARIDPQDYSVALENAKANLEKSVAALTFAENDYARAIRIQQEDPGAISASMVDRKREDRNRLRAQIKSNQAEVQAAKNQLSYTYLKAPFNGMVVATYVDNFEHVRPKQPVLRMLNTSRVEMVVDIPESIISYIPTVKSIVVRFDSFPGQEFPAEVKEIGTEASTTTRTYPVTLVMKQPKEIQILAGMSGEAKFIGKVTSEEEAEAIVVPTSAVFSDKESKKSYLWVIDRKTHRVERKEVTLGELVNNGIRVRQGIQPGEWIAIAGVHYLHEGQEITILNKEELE